MNTKIIWKVNENKKLMESVIQFVQVMKKQKIDLIAFAFEYDDEVTMYRLYAHPLYEKFEVDYYNG